MAHVLMDTAFPDSAEAVELGRRLAIRHAWCHALRLWAWAIDQNIESGVIYLDNERIAEVSSYRGSADEYVAALVASNLLRPADGGGHYIAGWSRNKEYFKKRERMRTYRKALRDKHECYNSGGTRDATRDATGDTTRDSTRAPIPYQSQSQSLNHEVIQHAQQTPKPKKKTQAERPEEVTQQTWDDFLAHRKAKRAPVSQSVIDGFAAEAQKAGITLEAAMLTCMRRGWQGFESDWLATKPEAKAETPQQPKVDEFAAAGLPPRSDPRYDKAKSKSETIVKCSDGKVAVYLAQYFGTYLHPETLEKIPRDKADEIYAAWRKRKQEVANASAAQ